MAFIDGLPEEERQDLEHGFREHLAAGAAPAMVAKKFAGGETWVADPIIRREALSFIQPTPNYPVNLDLH